jgi:murein DD-endopeptidase MepM/ murein hydrolase activator NlpD
VLAAAATIGTGAVLAATGDQGRVPTGPDAAAPRPHADPSASARSRAARARKLALRPSDRLSWPLHGSVTGRFGEPRAGHMHEGLDIPMPHGAPIRAAAAGTVVMREWQDGYGRYTCIAHRTLTTCYAHQSRFRTRLGARVRRGQVIGYVGSTGATAVNHLHFEVRRGTKPWGKPLNPARRLPRS